MSNTTDRTELPLNGNVESWTSGQKAIVQAAGLTFTYPTWGNVPAELQGTTIPAPRAVVEHFLSVCSVTGLNPLARQIYCIARYGKGGVEWSIQTAIDGFRVVAERSKQYDGQAPFEWMTADQKWVDVFLPGIHGDHPLAARAKVYRKDWPKDRPSVGIAEWNAYVQTTRDGKPTSMWAKQGPGQLAKCAEALAFRKAFPQDLSGVYTDDESAGPAAAIASSREEDAIVPYDWQGEIDAVDLDGFADLQRRLGADPTATTEHFAALLFRKAVLLREDAARPVDADIVDEPEATTSPDDAPVPASEPVSAESASVDPEPRPTPETGAQPAPQVEASDWTDDPEWKGAPCPVCEHRHDITDHDDDEFTPAQALRQRAQSAAMHAPKFDASAMGAKS